MHRREVTAPTLRTIAIDWSGDARDPVDKTWIAEARDGEIVRLEPITRADVERELLAMDGPVVVGLDFAFSFPRWFTDEHGARSVEAVWEVTAKEGERWLAECPPPFWGRPGRKRPPNDPDRPAFRAMETVCARQPKSVFQVGGAGAVGTGSIRGMPMLARLGGAGWSIWPFHASGDRTAFEIYPRLLTGPVNKSSFFDRRAYVRKRLGDVEARGLAASSEDAFDAAVSALVMDQHRASLERMEGTGDVEGAIWTPPES